MKGNDRSYGLLLPTYADAKRLPTDVQYVQICEPCEGLRASGEV